MDDHYINGVQCGYRPFHYLEVSQHCKHKYLTRKTRGNNVEYTKIKYPMPGIN